MRLLKQLVAVAVVAFAGGALVGAVQGNAFVTLVLGLATAVLAVVVYARVVRWSERRAPVEVAVRGAAPAVGRGLLIGAGMFAAVIVNLAFLGYFRVDGLGSVTGMIGLLGFMAAAAVTEELMFRGVLFRIVEQWTGTWIALGLSGLVFGLMHLGSEHASLWGAIAIAVESGGMLAAAYAATRTLWLPIGLHFGWNFAEAGVFSAEVSGNGATHGLLNSVTSGPALLTGGDFGPEASPYAVLFGALLTIAFMWLARRRGNLVPLRRHARAAATATLSR
ncbi:CPBP family intramembrane glutamic endopeptidase [Microbispora hainanensis]|uniref:CPBP family intramembrane metalloprotease n=1 Tax=Microbispora hainanensis TaxID=568844 RepID=A0A544YT06_9ACTN|nr:CPBP family intramembrane glutamic endopeptidase [Microbispora hainanensis]TQS19894.1 CPBP family intramembrane metalloprotease [Microbispora hainanensis]